MNTSGSAATSKTKTSGRFRVDYVIEAESEALARKLGRELCLEQTVELPSHIDAVKDVEAFTVGAVENVTEIRGSRNKLFRVTAAFPNDTAGGELTQFLNVVFGNTSLKRGVSVANVTLNEELQENREMFPGPQFGIQGLRDILRVPEAPLLCTALKPMGRSAEEFGKMAYALAKGGIDIIKDDHGLANQVWAPFKERVSICAKAVQKANEETGRNCLYAPCLNAPMDKLLERARYAKEVGAGAIMVLPGIIGFDAVRVLASDPKYNLPILLHPALLGGWLDSENDDDGDGTTSNTGKSTSHIHHPHGLSHDFLFGILPRLCGADAVIFPNAGGRFQFTPEECLSVANGCRRPMGRFLSILPSPAGGMKLDRVEEMRNEFGDDTLFLIGGALLEQGPDLEYDAKLFAHSAGRDKPYHTPGDTAAAVVSPITIPPKDLPSIIHVEKVAMAVRRRVLEYTIFNNGGYLSQACSSAETLATLYLRALNLGPSIADPIPADFRGSPGPNIPAITGEGHNGDFNDPSLDRLIFSPVHYALVLYSLLVEIGRLDIAAFRRYNKNGSTVELIGAEHSPGHAVTAGSLSQALSQAAGIAYARRLKGHTGRVVVYMSDGEFQEGQTWEAIQCAVFHKIGNLSAVVDVNGQQCDGKMSDITDIGNLASKLRAFGANVKEVDGHNVAEIEAAIKSYNDVTPTIVLCYTDPCKGFPLLQKRAPKLHYVRFKDETEKQVWVDVLSKMDPEMKVDANISDINTNTKHRLEVNSENEKRAAKRQALPIQATSNLTNDGTETSPLKAGNAELVTRPHRSHLVDWIKSHPKAIVLTADLTSSCEADVVRDNLPDQYLSMGMAEQNMMSFAGGLAREGFHPYIHTFGVFVTRRPFDQVAMSIAVPNLPVRLLGFLPGLTTPGGVTHQAIDDVALFRAVPNMTILEVGDASEVESVMDVAESINGPVYVRMWRGQVPRLFSTPMKYGVVRVLSEGTDFVLITSGICTEESLKARRSFEAAEVTVKHLHLSTIVPFPSDIVVKAAVRCKYGVIVMENHSIIGGVGSATAEALAEAGIGRKLIRLGVPGVYAHGASCDYLVAEYGFDSTMLIHAAESLTGKQIAGAVETEEGSMKQPALSAEERPEDL